MTGPRVSLTLRSKNSKVGRIPVSMSERRTCPPSCPLLGNGCYADAGFYTRLHWDRLDAGTAGVPWEEFIDRVRALKPGQLWRHDVGGDLAGKDDEIDAELLDQLVWANEGKRGFTYTHYPIDQHNNREVIASANAQGFTVNVSCQTLTEVDAAMERGLPAVVLLPANQRAPVRTPDGNVVAVCPAYLYPDTTCSTCRVCSRPDRKVAVGFPVHGVRANLAAKLVGE